MGDLKLAELSQPLKEGGLDLVDTQSRADTLLLRQTCRMIGRKETGYRHISYWLSSELREQMTLDDGPRSLTRPPKMQQSILLLIKKARQDMSERDLLQQTANSLYKRELKNLPLPRLQRRNEGVDMVPVWKRLSSPVLGVRERHQLFIMANGILRNKEDVFMRWGQGELTCDHNPDPDGRCAGQPQSVRHLYQGCTRAAEAWDWLYRYLCSYLPPAILSEADCVSLFYPSLGSQETEDCTIWLLGSYQEAMSEAIEKGRVLGEQELRGFLRQKLAAYNLKSMRPINLVNL